MTSIKSRYIFYDRNVGLLFDTQVLLLKVEDGLPVSVKEVYADDGAVLTGSSVAVRYEDSLLIGTISYKVLYCEIKYL